MPFQCPASGPPRELVPTATHDELVVHEIPLSDPPVPSDGGTRTTCQVEPFQCSARDWYRMSDVCVTPTASHHVVATHETLVRSLHKPVCLCGVTEFQDAPFHRNANGIGIESLDPTAMHQRAVTQETPLSWTLAFDVWGADMRVHRTPFHPTS